MKNKPCGLEFIPNKIYKLLANKISIHVAALYNQSIKKGVFPDILKISRVTPIPKDGDLSLPTNYRPISQTETISKIFEQIIYKQVSTYLEGNKLLSDYQFGFRKNKTTEDAILSLTENIYKNLNDKKISVLLSLDLKKAFDVINLDILISKLDNIGIKGNELCWFKSYLFNRKQYVKLNNYASEYATVSNGVPQGSVLGPMLFSIYINDFDNCHESFSVRFADDTSILLSGSNINELQHKANREVEQIANWLSSNKLALNANKTTYIIISNIKQEVNINIRINNTEIKRVTHFKLLGTILDDKLNFKKHIDLVITKIAYFLYVLRKVKGIFSKRILTSLYYCLVFPYLNYNLTVWGGTSDYIIRPLIIMQKKIIRILNGSTNLVEHTSPLFKRMKIIKLKDLFHSSQAAHIYKIYNNIGVEPLKQSIQVHQRDRRRIIRGQTHNLDKANYKLTKARNALAYLAVENWNKLDTVTKSAPSLSVV